MTSANGVPTMSTVCDVWSVREATASLGTGSLRTTTPRCQWTGRSIVRQAQYAGTVEDEVAATLGLMDDAARLDDEFACGLVRHGDGGADELEAGDGSGVTGTGTPWMEVGSLSMENENVSPASQSLASIVMTS